MTHALESTKVALAKLELMSVWKPSASLNLLEARAALLNKIRAFFSDREVLEVETPILADSGITESNIELFEIQAEPTKYLQSSPEFAMKKLLCAGSGPIFQITKAFRMDEFGKYHNPEFSILEWYRPGYDYHRLMTEVFELVRDCLERQTMEKTSYRKLFLDVLQVDPLIASDIELQRLASSYFQNSQMEISRSEALDFLVSHVLQSELRERGVCFIFDYPEEQAGLASLKSLDDGTIVAERFELYVDGIELANGCTELSDSLEQKKRLITQNALKEKAGKQILPIDDRFLSAIESGLPFCSGVAMGLDRLLMLQSGRTNVSETLSFSWDRC